MSAFNRFNCFILDVGLKKHDLDGDTLKVLLSNTAPVVTNTVKTDITEISAGSGYTAGGYDVQGVWTQSSGVAQLACTNVVVAASGGSIGPFQYAVLYNDTASSKNLIGWWPVNTAITVAAGEAYTLAFSNNAFSIG